MKKILSVLLFATAILTASTASATDVDSLNTAKVREVRHELVTKHKLNEAQVIKLYPAIRKYVIDLAENKEAAEASLKKAIDDVKAAVYTRI